MNDSTRQLAYVGLIIILVGLGGFFWSWRKQHPTLTREPQSDEIIATLAQADVTPTSTQTESTPKKDLKPIVSHGPISPRIACKVLFVYDGDTVACDLNKDNRIQKPKEEIRMLGIDTPEMRYSKKNRTHGTSQERDEPYAAEASHHVTQMLSFRTAYLEFDKKRQDRHGRTLAYVYLDPTGGESISASLLKQGYATVLVIPPNIRNEQEFLALEATARKQKLGLWREF